MSQQDLPVIIVGAGPVGLSLATALCQQGIDVHVFEALPELSNEARASTFHPPTLEMFAQWGVLDHVLRAGHKVHALQYWERESRELVAEFNYNLIANDTPYPFRLQCPQSVLTRLLKPLLQASPHCAIHMHHELIHFEDEETHVKATFNTPQGQKTVNGRYLCAADGAKSVVRKQLALAFNGLTYADRFFLIATDIDFQPYFPGLGAVSYHFDPHEWVIILHLPDMVRVVFKLRNDEDDNEVVQEQAIKARIAPLLNGNTAYNIKSTAIYNVHQRVAETFRVGKVILLGDAAHINNPAGGMGMNSGIHDAYHLAPRLIRVLNGESEALLDEYSALRKAYAQKSVQEYTHKHYNDLAASDAAERQNRNAEFRALGASPEKGREFLLRASMMAERI